MSNIFANITVGPAESGIAGAPLGGTTPAGSTVATPPGATAAPAPAGDTSAFFWFAIVLVVVSFAFIVFRRRAQSRGTPPSTRGSFGSQFTRGTADRTTENLSDKTFADVAGCEEAIKRLKRVKRWLKHPGMYKIFGARLPKGVLMVGPPGTGKTLLAKALAGEAGASFFNCAGSDFVEVYVGLGASRVREKFAAARKSVKDTGRPAILFIDEIDAVGKKRSGGGPAANDERDQTLNAILVEMDGFAPNQSILVIAATNRADILDPALKRPGRFDYQVAVDLPDMNGRSAIFGVHMRGKPVAKGIDMKLLAKRSPGMSGADIEGVCNEAATLAGERVDEVIVELRTPGKTDEQITALVKPHLDIEESKLGELVAALKTASAIEDEAKSAEEIKVLIEPYVGIRLKEFDEAVDIVRMGDAKKSLYIPPEQLEQTAIHEWGHLAVKKHKGERVTKVTIVPRMNALGYTESAPEENVLNYTKQQMRMHILMCMGGRAAQKMLLNTEDTGAGNDFEQATRFAKGMVMKYGFSELGPISIDEQDMAQFGGSNFVGEKLKDKINDLVLSILNECQKEAEQIILADRARIERGTKYMLEVSDTMLEPEIDMVWEGTWTASEPAPKWWSLLGGKSAANLPAAGADSTSQPTTAVTPEAEPTVSDAQPKAAGNEGDTASTK